MDQWGELEVEFRPWDPLPELQLEKLILSS